MVTQKYSDVCLYFPRSGRRLWADQSILAKVSPYFPALFESEFSEAAELTTITQDISEEEEDVHDSREDPYEFDDSDTEIDAATRIASEEDKVPAVPCYKTITITQHTYETYLSLLCWIGTGRITFAPLRSTSKYPQPDQQPLPSTSSDNDFLLDKPRSPAPVSPKSIYRLAHYLELQGELSQLALENFKSQLTVENIM